MSYTKGPWQWIKQIGGGPALVYDDDDGGGVVIEASMGSGILIWNDADRDLIAAAPELYEALTELLEQCGHAGVNLSAMDAAERVIAKAEGKS